MEMIPVVSSNINSIGYEPDTHTLRAEFKGGATYEYNGVPPEVHKTVMDSGSVGGAFSMHVKASFTGRRI